MSTRPTTPQPPSDAPRCGTCGKPYVQKHHCWLPACHCHTFAVPVRADNTAVMPDGRVVKVDPTTGIAS